MKNEGSRYVDLNPEYKTVDTVWQRELKNKHVIAQAYSTIAKKKSYNIVYSKL